MKKLIIAIIGIAAASAVTAQQTPLSNFYNFNQYLLNPAEAGADYKIAGTGSHRIQWQGLNGAPRTTFLGVHGSLNENMGIGGNILVDQTDILKQFNASLSYAYRIKLNEKAMLSFGVSGMMVQNSIGYGDAVIGDYADEVINGGTEAGTTFDAEAGIMLQYGKGKLGVASSHLFESGVEYNLSDNRGRGTFERVRQFSAYGSYTFELSENWNIEPTAIVRNQGVNSFQMEASAMAAWKETLYLGAGFRQEAGYIGRIGFQITEQIIAAYAYEFSNTGIASYSSGSHEFMIGYRIGRKVKSASTKVRLANDLTTVENIEEKVVEEPKAKPAVEPKVEEKVVVEEKVESVVPKAEVEAEENTKVTKELQLAFKKDVKFEFASGNKEHSTIDQNEGLDLIAEFLKQNKNQRVLIKGHTCDRGGDSLNTIYSTKRANTVKSYLLSKGVNENQLEIKAMLDREPLLPNTSEANRRVNRRVEIELIN